MTDTELHNLLVTMIQTMQSEVRDLKVSVDSHFSYIRSELTTLVSKEEFDRLTRRVEKLEESQQERAMGTLRLFLSCAFSLATGAIAYKLGIDL
jgi:hypothetical protein